MLNSKGERELAYIVTIDEIRPIEGYDRVEYARVGGWWVIVSKNQFKVGDPAIYFEIDSKAPPTEPFAFLAKRDYKVKTLKMCKVISQGLLMHPDDFGWTVTYEQFCGDAPIIHAGTDSLTVGDFVTKRLGVTYADVADNIRKAAPVNKYAAMKDRHKKFFSSPFGKFIFNHKITKKIAYIFLGKRKDTKKDWPVGRFPGVSKTDQERVENMPFVLSDKTPYIVTQKCDGSSGTYILEKKPFGRYEFYVCSRNVRMANEKQASFYGEHNYYWEVAKIYDIKNKMKQYLTEHPDIKWVCWQGEICAPGIQKNPHHLTVTHFYCFHWTDSKNGRLNILDAYKLWTKYNMAVVPIVNKSYVLPDDFEELKLSADGNYAPFVCEGKSDCPREGFVYYKTTDPTFSFKNVSRQYLLKH